ncbi:MAG: hypothetical protein AAF721_24965, partial [Myxococcota bacterium]
MREPRAEKGDIGGAQLMLRYACVSLFVLAPLAGCADLQQAGGGPPNGPGGGKSDDPDAMGGTADGGDDAGSDDDTTTDGGQADDGGSDDGGSDDATDGGETGDGGDGDPEPVAPARYPADRTHSPISPWVADRLLTLSETVAHATDVFMNVGDSITVGSGNLKCFAGGNVDLGEHEGLDPTLGFFLGGDAAGEDAFSRESLAAEVGRSAGWAISGQPSPVDAEVSAVDPAIALVQYGTNDMQLGATFDSALPGFYVNMSSLLDGLIADG